MTKYCNAFESPKIHCCLFLFYKHALKASSALKQYRERSYMFPSSAKHRSIQYQFPIGNRNYSLDISLRKAVPHFLFYGHFSPCALIATNLRSVPLESALSCSKMIWNQSIMSQSTTFGIPRRESVVLGRPVNHHPLFYCQ